MLTLIRHFLIKYKQQYIMDFYLEEISRHYKYHSEQVYRGFLLYFPRFDNFNRFQKFILLNLIILIAFFVVSLVRSFTPVVWYKTLLKALFKLPFVKAGVQKELAKMKLQTTNGFPQQCRTVLRQIPYKVPEIKIGDDSDKQSLKGYLSGSRYPIKAHSDFVMNLSKKFAFSNPLHVELFPFVKQMQVQVIHMCAKMLNFTNKKGIPVGSLNGGGTQSIMLSILAYREYKYKYENVRNPNLVVCKTGHVAALKACQYFGIQARIVGYNKNYEMSVSQMKSKIDSNTICVYTSYPNFPYGTIDPIEEIAKVCKAKNVPVHVDMCLGGFLVPFLSSQCEKDGFRLPQGVTSVSMDPHKYGLSAKGASISLFSDEIYRNCHMFTTMFWPGGLYGTSGFAGSRSGMPISASWISMMKMGEEGYRKNAHIVQQATTKLAKQLKTLGFKVYGQPRICCIGFDHPKYSVSSIQKFMKEKKWNLSLNQLPICFHYCFTPLNCTRVDEMVKDFKECVQCLQKQPASKQKDTGMLELYGACAKIPDNHTKDLILCNLLDCFTDL